MLEQQSKVFTVRWPSNEQTLFVSSDTTTVASWLAAVHAAQQHFQQQNGHTGMLYQANLYEFSVLLFGLLAAGKNVILPPNAQPETIKRVSEYCDFICKDRPQVRAHFDSAITQIEFPADATITFFTSGSSGEPKVIRKLVSQLMLEASMLEQTFGTKIPATALVAATVPANHIYGFLFRLLWPLSSGRAMYQPTVDYYETLQCIQQPYFLVSSPAHLSRFENLQSLPLKPLHISSSGGPLALDTSNRIQRELGFAPIEVFGSTETGGIAWREGQQEQRPWQLFSGIKMRQNSAGCLVIQSPYVSETTWIETQDKIEALDARRFHLRGRADRIVKLAEKRVSLPEMEAFCEQHSVVKEARLALLSSVRPTLGAVLVLSPEGQKALEQSGKHVFKQRFRDYLCQRFDRVVVPRKFRYVTRLPSDDRGKVSEQKVQELFQ